MHPLPQTDLLMLKVQACGYVRVKQLDAVSCIRLVERKITTKKKIVVYLEKITA